MIAYGSEAYFAYPPRPTDPKIAWEPDWQTKVRVKSTYFSILGGMGGGDPSERQSGRSQDASPQTQPAAAEKKQDALPNPVELLKGLFGR